MEKSRLQQQRDSMRVQVAQNIEEVRKNALDIASDMHTDYKITNDVKYVDRALKAYNIGLTSAKTQLAYAKLLGMSKNGIDFLTNQQKLKDGNS